MKTLRTVVLCVPALAAVCCLASCGNLTPPAGSYSEVLLVTEGGEQSEWAKLLTPIIAREIDYYVDFEEEFRITSVGAAEMEDFPAFKNIVLCGVLEASTDVGQRIIGMIGDVGVEQVLHQGARILKKSDRPAANQFTLVVTAPDADALRAAIDARGDEINGILEESCRERLRRHLLKRRNEKITADLSRKYGFEVQVPTVYRILSDESDPPGVEIIREPPTRILGVFWTDRGTAPTIAEEDELFSIRAAYVWKRYDKDEMDRDRVIFEPARLGRYDAIRMSGYWYNDEQVIGGYYETYFIFDERADLLWAVDLLVLAPGKPKHPLVRELRALAETIRFI
jgi:hypothetical protein